MMKIELKKAIAPTLSSRDIIEVIKNRIEESDVRDFIIDFSGIIFISRSAADELLKLKKQYSHLWNKKRVKFENLSFDVSQMLELVKRQQNKHSQSTVDIKTVDFKEFIKI